MTEAERKRALELLDQIRADDRGTYQLVHHGHMSRAEIVEKRANTAYAELRKLIEGSA